MLKGAVLRPVPVSDEADVAAGATPCLFSECQKVGGGQAVKLGGLRRLVVCYSHPPMVPPEKGGQFELCSVLRIGWGTMHAAS
jgi:hypothetical protein